MLTSFEHYSNKDFSNLKDKIKKKNFEINTINNEIFLYGFSELNDIFRKYISFDSLEIKKEDIYKIIINDDEISFYDIHEKLLLKTKDVKISLYDIELKIFAEYFLRGGN